MAVIKTLGDFDVNLLDPSLQEHFPCWDKPNRIGTWCIYPCESNNTYARLEQLLSDFISEDAANALAQEMDGRAAVHGPNELYMLGDLP